MCRYFSTLWREAEPWGQAAYRQRLCATMPMLAILVDHSTGHLHHALTYYIPSQYHAYTDYLYLHGALTAAVYLRLVAFNALSYVCMAT